MSLLSKKSSRLQKSSFTHIPHRGKFIHPLYPLPPELQKISDAYIGSIEGTLCQMLPGSFISALHKKSHYHLLPGYFEHFDQELPLITWSFPDKGSGSIVVNLLCQSDLTHGLGRYFSDLASRWLLPGKFLAIWNSQIFNFKFTTYPRKSYFFCQLSVHIETEEDLAVVKEHLPRVAQELTLNLHSTRLARSVIATKQLSENEKKALVQENVFSLFGRKETDTTPFDHLHQFWLQLDYSCQALDYRAKFNHFLKKAKPKIHDRDIFYEIEHLTNALTKEFKALRSLQHLKRLVTYQYLFSKMLVQENGLCSEKRRLSLKILRTRLNLPSGKKPVIGVLGVMNILQERELFKEAHLVKAIRTILPSAISIPHSYYAMENPYTKLRFFYLEIQKDCCTQKELAALQTTLPKAVKTSIETPLAQIFMPPDLEDTSRHFTLLQLEHQRRPNMPHAMITFSHQTEETLLFNIVFVRNRYLTQAALPDILKSAVIPFENFDFPNPSSTKDDQAEVSCFQATLKKNTFLRADFSIDLLKARQTISESLKSIVGGFRDYNGGNFSLQCALFQKVYSDLGEAVTKNELLLEDFFYHFTPLSSKNHPRIDRMTALFRLLLKCIASTDSFVAQHLESALLVTCKLPKPHLKQTLIGVSQSFHSGWFYHTSAREDGTTYLNLILDPFDFDKESALVQAFKTSLIL